MARVEKCLFVHGLRHLCRVRTSTATVNETKTPMGFEDVWFSNCFFYPGVNKCNNCPLMLESSLKDF